MEKYFLSPYAEQDIDDVIIYLAPENPKAADDFVDSLYDAFNKLAENPMLGHAREDLTKRPVRYCVYDLTGIPGEQKIPAYLVVT